MSTPARDRRYSSATKVGLSPLGAAFMGVLRAAIATACRDGTLTRARLSHDLQVPEKTIEKWLTPSETLSPRFEHVLRMLAPEGPLPAVQREFVQAWLDRENGRINVSLVAADPDEAPVGVQVAQVFAAGGRVAGMVAVMTAPDSDGGHELTREEARAILPVARDELREVSELVATLERIAGAGGLGRRLDVMA